MLVFLIGLQIVCVGLVLGCLIAEQQKTPEKKNTANYSKKVFELTAKWGMR